MSIDIFQGAPIWLNVFMNGSQFKNIISALLFNNIPPPSFKVNLFEIRHNIVSWNDHMKDVFYHTGCTI